MPPDTIVLNTEQVEGTYENWNAKILHWVSRFETWDYPPGTSMRSLVIRKCPFACSSSATIPPSPDSAL